MLGLCSALSLRRVRSSARSRSCSRPLCNSETANGVCVFHRVTAVMAKGKHPVTFRTRKLSSSAPMVLHRGRCGRVGRRRTIFHEGPHLSVGAFVFSGKGSEREAGLGPSPALIPWNLKWLRGSRGPAEAHPGSGTEFRDVPRNRKLREPPYAYGEPEAPADEDRGFSRWSAARQGVTKRASPTVRSAPSEGRLTGLWPTTITLEPPPSKLMACLAPSHRIS
jgi:hypothetical protein